MTETEAIHLPTIAILGAGSMGRAILSGLLVPHVRVAGGIRVTNRSVERAAELEDTVGVTAYATAIDPEANRTAVAGAKVILVAVKPHMVPDLLAEIRDVVEPGAVVVSVAAGVTVATFESLLPEQVSVLRSMPNTPAVVGRAVTGLSAGTRSTPEDRAVVTELFSTIGTVLEVPEAQLDAVTSISGSGPAYVLYLIECLTEAAVDKGFTPEQSAILVNNTFLGAAELLAASDRSPAQLRQQVTSPGGTTAMAMAVLEAGGLTELFRRATDAAFSRAQELSNS